MNKEHANMPSEHRSSLIGAAIMLIILAIFANRCSAAVATAGKRCGSKVCDPLDYCSPLHEQCVPCERICSVSNNNHDAQLCASECDVYLHEQSTENLTGAIRRLQAQQTLTVVLLAVLAALFVLVNGVQAVRWMRRHDRLSCTWLKALCTHNGGASKSARPSTLAPEQLTHANPHTQSPKLQRPPAATANLSLGALETQRSPVLRTVSELHRQASTAVLSDDGMDNLSTVHTVSTPISRHPAEDSTESYSYDNAGLQMTPTTQKPPKSETKF